MVNDERARGGEARLQKILAAAGVASRRASEELIRAGRVTVNGSRAQLGQSADPARDAIAVDGEPIEREPLEYWLAHKPPGVLTTVSDPFGRPTVVELLPERAGRLFPVGRLDRDTEGLVLLTNDGALANRLLHPSYGVEREYQVTVRGHVKRRTFQMLARGVELDGVSTARARVSGAHFDEDPPTSRFELVLTEGRKRQIRRALRALGHPVIRLVRVRMGPLRLGRLRAGGARPLNPGERRALARVRERVGRPRNTSRTRN